MFKLHQTVPLICPSCRALARPSGWKISAHLLLALVLGAGLYLSFATRFWWAVLAGLIVYYAGTYPLRYIPLVQMQSWQVKIHRIIHYLVVIFLTGLILLAGYTILGHGGP